MKFDLLKFDISKIDLTKIDLSKLDINNTKIIKIISLSFLLLAFVLDLFLFLPLTDKIKRSKARVEVYNQDIVFSKNLLSQKNKLIKVNLIREDDVDALMDKIYDIGAKSGVEIVLNNNLKEDPSFKDNSYYSKMTFSLNASGTLKDLGTFLNKIKESSIEAILDVEAINIASDADNGSHVKAEIQYSLFTTKINEDR